MRFFTEKYKQVIPTVKRFTVTLVLIVLLGVFNAIIIEQEVYQSDMIWLTLLIGVMLSVIAQLLYERIEGQSNSRRMLLVGLVLSLSGVYYVVLRNTVAVDERLYAVSITVILCNLLVIAWIPTIRSSLSFEKTFMMLFKRFFTTILFTSVMTISILIVLFAIDTLILSLYENLYAHLMNIVFIFFAPFLFLLQEPMYRTSEVQQGAAHEMIIPNTLRNLLIYILLPFVSIYTLIVLLYIALNIHGPFWQGNALESMIISYTVITIIVLLLVQQLPHPIVHLFQTVIPKALLLIVLLQVSASIVEMNDVGMTHGRYYVIFYCVFALLTSLMFSIPRLLNYTVIVVAFIILSIVSIVPPTDAFTVSRLNEVHTLKTILIEHGMLEKEVISPNGEISTEEQKRITQIVSYLDQMGYTEQIEWLGQDILANGQFQRIFGFAPIEEWGMNGEENARMAYLNEESLEPIDISTYDRMFSLNVYETTEQSKTSFTVRDQTYTLHEQYEQDHPTASILRKDQVIGEIDFREVFDKVLSFGEELTIDQATIREETSQMNIMIIVRSASDYDEAYSGEVYVFIQLKD